MTQNDQYRQSPTNSRQKLVHLPDDCPITSNQKKIEKKARTFGRRARQRQRDPPQRRWRQHRLKQMRRLDGQRVEEDDTPIPRGPQVQSRNLNRTNQCGQGRRKPQHGSGSVSRASPSLHQIPYSTGRTGQRCTKRRQANANSSPQRSHQTTALGQPRGRGAERPACTQ